MRIISAAKVLMVMCFLVLLERVGAAYLTRMQGLPFPEQLFAPSPIPNLFMAFEDFLLAHEKSLMVAGTLALVYFTWTLYRTARNQLAASGKALVLSERSLLTAEQTIIATQRPWVSVEVGLAGPLVINDTEVRVKLGFTLKNVGKSPALNTRIHQDLVPFMSGSDDGQPIKKAKQLREELKNRPVKTNSVLGQLVFPDQEYRQSINVGIPLDRLRQSLPAQGGEMFAIDLIGFVSYRTSFDDEIHLTPIHVALRKKDPANPERNTLFRFDEPKVEIDQYVIMYDPFVGGVAD